MLMEKLQDEKQRQQDNNRLVTSWLKKEKDSWFYPSEFGVEGGEARCVGGWLFCAQRC